MLAVDYQTVQKTRILHTTSLLDQLCQLSATLQEIGEEQHDLSEQQQLLHEQQQALYGQQYILYKLRAEVLEKYSSVLTQLSCMRERGLPSIF